MAWAGTARTSRARVLLRLVVGTLLLCTALSIIWLFCVVRPAPSYRFAMESIRDPAEVIAVSALASELERIGRDEQRIASGDSAAALAGLLRLETNRSASRWTELLRAGEDTELRLPGLNGTILLLASDPGAPGVSEVRSLKTESEAKRAILVALERRAAERREVLYTRAVNQPLLTELSSRNAWPPWPPFARESRWEALRRLLGGESARAVWVRSFLRDSEPLRQLADWEGTLRCLDEISWDGSRLPPPGLYLKVVDAPRSGAGLAPGARELSAYMNFAVRFRTRADSAASGVDSLAATGAGPLLLDRDTGMRLHDVVVASDRATGEPRLEATGATLIVERDGFEQFLHSQGLPGALRVLDITPHLAQRKGGPHLVLSFTLEHPEVAGSAHPVSVELPVTADPSQLTESIVPLRREALRKLDRSLRSLTEYHGWQISLAPEAADGANAAFAARIGLGTDRSLSFRLDRLQDGRLFWQEALSLEERLDLTDHIAQAEPGLARLLPWLSLADVAFVPDAVPHLEGVLLPSNPDALGDEGLGWSIDARGGVTFTSQALPSWDSSSRTQSGVRQSPRITADEVRALLRARHPFLAARIEVAEPRMSPHGTLVMLGLRIADWPILQLGPAEIRSGATLDATLDRLLSEEELSARSAVQWGYALASPGRGMRRSRITEWSVETGEVVVQSRLRLLESPPIGLAWDERLTLEEDGWRSQSEAELCRRLDPEQLERQVRDLAYQTLGIDLRLKIDREAFGTGAWMRLHPPAVALRGELRPLPSLDWLVGVDGIVLDPGGLTLPAGVTFMASPLTIPTPHFCLSDPSMRIDLRRYGVDLQAKLTPPLPIPKWGESESRRAGSGERMTESGGRSSAAPGPEETGTRLPVATRAAVGLLRMFGFGEEGDATVKGKGQQGGASPRRRLRPDNPWIHLVYAQVELGGVVSDPEIRGQTTIRLIERHDAARGTIHCRFAIPRLEATIEAQPIPAVGFPHLDGRLSADRISGFSMSGHYEMAGIDVEASLRFLPPADSESVPGAVQIDGRAQLPLAGRTRVMGRSDLRFERPVIDARGEVPWGGQALRYHLHADRDGYTLLYGWDAGRKPVRLIFEGTTLDEDERGRVEAAVTDRVLASRRGAIPREPTEEEWTLIRQAPAIDMDFKGVQAPPDEEPEPMEDPESGQGPGLAQPVSPGDLVVEIQEGTLVIRSHSKDTLYVRTPPGRLQMGRCNPDLCRFTVWDLGGRGAQLLAVNYETSQVIQARFEDPTVPATVEDLNARFQMMGPLFPPGEEDRSTVLRTLVAYLSVTLGGYQVDAPRKVGPGYLVEYRRVDPAGSEEARPRTFGLYLWTRESTRYTAYLRDELVPRDRHGVLLPRLGGLTLQQGGPLVLAFEAGARSRVALLSPVGAKYRMTLDAADRTSPVLEIRRIAGGGRADRMLMLRDFTEWAWRTGTDLRGRAILLGPEGICVAGSNGWWLFPGGPASEDLSPRLPGWLARERFDRWDDPDSLRYLPEELRDPEARRAASPEQIAVQAVARRDAGRWEVSPMGLLVRLALQGAPGAP